MENEQNDQLILISGASSTGKAQPLHCEIKSPIRANLTFGSVQIGDDIFGEDGKIYKVLDVIEQGEQDCYEITFNDGSSTCCNDRHLWTYYRGKKHLPNYEGVYTAELKTIRKLSTQNIYFKCPEPVSYPENVHLIQPELMGMLLAEGGFTQTSITISVAEQEMIDRLQSFILEPNYSFHKNKGDNYNYILKYENFRGSKYDTNIYKNEIRRLGLLGLCSTDKFIPEEYLRDSYENRMRLLIGMFNCDGSLQRKKHQPGSPTASYSTTSKRLRDDLLELCRSLGYRVSYSSDHRHWKYTSGECFSVTIHTSLDRKLPFDSRKHLDKYTYPIKYVWQRRAIKSIEYVGKTEMRCITTSNPSGLYLTDDFIVTHNSASLANIRDPDKWFYFNCEHKRLPFKSKFQEFRITDPYQVHEGLDVVAENKEVKGVIIDTVTFLMDQMESQHVLTSSNTMKA